MVKPELALTSLIRLIALVGLVWLLAGPAFGQEGRTIADGYYVGHGDGATTVLKIFSDQRVTLSSILFFSKVNLKTIVAASKISSGAYPGRIDHVGDRYILIFRARPNLALPSCQYGLKIEKLGLTLTTASAGCTFYHGATWGFGSGQGSILRRVR